MRQARRGKAHSGIVEALKTRYTLAANPAAEQAGDPYRDYTDVNLDTMLVTWVGEPITMKEVLYEADSCPMCTLAILRQTGLNRHYFHLEEWDYKKEVQFFNHCKYHNED